ncbi:DNA polymerase III subunit gamma/tau [Floccifex sp.]|uniref:DNA polymerase III subunit gamma/tau n=1 Tax=Floccifex sp. TaxID=2815810 RepID=UPI003F0ED98D
MAYQALYRKYRPKKFEDVVGQEHIIQTLKNAVYQNKIAHAYLFCGPRGTGKTTIAKIFAKMLNCENENKPCGECENCKMSSLSNHPDIIEIDAASNNGVEEVRNLIDKVKYAPLIGKYKVYIIDEVHMMSSSAFNALLKTIEEPPEHVIFIFATTEPNKVIPTIISRCQRYDFSKVSEKDISKRLNIVCKQENIEIDEDAISLIARLADGGMRDSLSILDQCIAYCITNIKADDVRKIYGVLNVSDIGKIYSYLANKDIDLLLNTLNQYANMGIDLQMFMKDFINLVKESIIMDYSSNTTLVSHSHKQVIQSCFSNTSVPYKLNVLNHLMDTYSKFVFASNVLDYIESCFLQILSESYDLKTNKIDIEKSYESINTKSERNNEFIKQDEIKEVFNTKEKSDVPQKINVSRETSDTENKERNILLNDEYIIQLLTGSNKKIKMEDLSKLEKMNGYLSNLEYGKYANSLMNMKLLSSSETYWVVVLNSNIQVKNVNNIQNEEGYENFMNELLGKPKKVFAITQEQSEKSQNEFLKRMKNNTLPEPAVVHVKIKNNHMKINKTEDELMKVFSDLEIIED